MTKILCTQTHNRLIVGQYHTFYEGEWYELTINNYYQPDVLGYYKIIHPLNKGNGCNVSKLFLGTRFLTVAKWREHQINSILND